jgi:hypothetical protein
MLAAARLSPFDLLATTSFAALSAALGRGLNLARDAFVDAWTVFMAVTHPTAVRTGIADFVVDQLDEGTPPGHLVFQTSGAVTVATLTFSNTAFGAAAAGTATAAAITSDTNAVGGTIAKAELRNAANTAKILCSVTATGGGGDIELNSVIVSAGQTVAMTSLTYSAPA